MLRTRVVWTGVAGSPYYTNYYWQGNGEANAQVAQDATTAWAQEIAPNITNLLTLSVVPEVYEIDPATGVIQDAFNVGGPDVPGLAQVEPLPYRTQLISYLGTTVFRRGRRVVGRTFLGGLVESQSNNGGGPTEVARALFEGIYRQNLLVETEGILVVWARPKEIVLGAQLPGEECPVTSLNTRATWSSLRSRGA